MDLEADLAWIMLIGFSTVGIEGKKTAGLIAYSLGEMLEVGIHGLTCKFNVRDTR